MTTKEQKLAWYHRNKEKVAAARATSPSWKEALKRYAQSPKGKANQARKDAKRRGTKKVAARYALRDAVKAGKIKREPCFCGDPKSHGHHDDYDKPLEVIWLCDKHHRERHKEMEVTDG
jgi:hypothetical protein